MKLSHQIDPSFRPSNSILIRFLVISKPLFIPPLLFPNWGGWDVAIPIRCARRPVVIAIYRRRRSRGGHGSRCGRVVQGIDNGALGTVSPDSSFARASDKPVARIRL